MWNRPASLLWTQLDERNGSVDVSRNGHRTISQNDVVQASAAGNGGESEVQSSRVLTIAALHRCGSRSCTPGAGLCISGLCRGAQKSVM